MVANNPGAPAPAELLADLLDRGYTTATRQVIASLARDTQTGPLADRLAQFDAHAAELAAAGQAVKADDPYLRALLAEFGTSLRKGGLLIDAAAPDVQQVGIDAAGNFVRQTTLPGMSDQQLAAVGIGWNKPDPEAVAQVVQYTTSDAWREELASYGDLENQVLLMALRGIVAGKGPVATANAIREAIATLPAWRANNIMRTLQLTAFRDATVLAQVANADILEPEIIRIAALDARTCMACVALHGTKLKLGERVNDHRQGRCTSITQLRGRPRTIRTGEAWFNGLSEAQQQAQMGPGAWAAWKAGAITLQDFPKPATDKVFGEVVLEASLKGMLGDAAQQYYQRSR